MLTQKVTVDPTVAAHQMLIERTASRVRSINQLRAALTSLIGEELASRLREADLSVLHVHGGRETQLALHLPYECLFDTPTLVVRHTDRRRATRRPAAGAGMLAAFALTEEAPYLPLHAEAAPLAALAHSAGIDYDELFLTWTADDLLRRGHGRALVHVAGHGTAGTIACLGDEVRTTVNLTSQDLIEAWQDSPPELILINTCHGSTASDFTSLFREFDGTTMAVARRGLAALGSQDAASTSMAVDLATALQTTVVSMSTAIADSAARRFAAAFYSHLLTDKVHVYEAFRGALRESDCHDASGLPVPTLFVGGLPRRLPERAYAEPRTLPDDLRRMASYHRAGTISLAHIGRTSWCGMLLGADPGTHATTLDLIRTAAAERGVTSDELEVRDLGPGGTFVSTAPTDSDQLTLAVFQLDWLLADEVAAEVELLDVARVDARLLALSCCQVPALVEGLRQVPLEELVPMLRATAAGRDPIIDRGLQWDLARVLIQSLPDEARDTVSGWSESRWERVQTLGRVGVDVVSAAFLLGDDQPGVHDYERRLMYLIRAGGWPEEHVFDAFDALADGVASVLGQLDGASPPLLRIDRLTAARAWAACSETAAWAYITAYLDEALQSMHDPEFLRTTGDLAVIWLADLAAAAGDDRVRNLIDLLKAHGRPDAAARLTKVADDRGIGPDAPAVDAVGQQLERAVRVGSTGAFTELIGELDAGAFEDDLPWQATRLAIEAREADPTVTVERARALTDAVLREAAKGGADLDRLAGTLGNLTVAMSTAYGNLGNAEAALDAQVGYFLTTARMGAPPVRLAYAASLAADALLRHARDAEARDIINMALSSIAEMRPVSGFIALQTVHVRTLVRENRLPLVKQEAAVLTSLISAWEHPHLGALENALYGLGSAELQLDEPASSVAHVALSDCLSDAPPTPARIAVSASLRDMAGVATSSLLRTAQARRLDLTETLERVDLDPHTVDARLERWFAKLATTEADRLGVLGPDRARALRARARAGCPVADNVIRGLEGAPDDDCRIPASWDIARLPELAVQYGSLASLVAPTLSDRFVAGLPVAGRAYRSDLDARVVFCALTAPDHGRHGTEGLGDYVVAMLEQAAPDEIARCIAGLPGRYGVQAALQLEQCIVEIDDFPEPDSTAELAEHAMQIWPALLGNAVRDADEAKFTLQLLRYVYGSTDAAVAAGRGIAPTTAQGRAKALAMLVRESPTIRAALSQALAQEGNYDAAMRLLPVPGPDDVNGVLVTVEARAAVYHAAGADDSARDELRVLAAAQTTGIDADGRFALLGAANTAMQVQAWEPALALNRTMLRLGPPEDGDAIDHHIRVTLGCAFNVTALIALTGRNELLAHLSSIYRAFGFGTLCHSIGSHVNGFSSEETAEVIELVVAAAHSGERDPFDFLLTGLSERFLAAISPLDDWAEVAAAVRVRIAAADAARPTGRDE
jgi:hypothetical protein